MEMVVSLTSMYFSFDSLVPFGIAFKPALRGFADVMFEEVIVRTRVAKSSDLVERSVCDRVN